ncbi:MAG: helix-turn-helix transcriptional regulator [Clostridiales bacterium]|nr:helix-turn-helix transcriptional regulator [Clostridiales bacterium]
MENTMISQRIRHYRRQAKLSQEDLAAKVDVSETYIRKLESGDRFPSLDMVLKLPRALSTTPDHLLLWSSVLSQNKSAGVLELLSDCTPTEFIILYENMVTRKKLLREHVK